MVWCVLYSAKFATYGTLRTLLMILFVTKYGALRNLRKISDCKGWLEEEFDGSVEPESSIPKVQGLVIIMQMILL